MPNSSVKILLVDDSPDLLESISFSLKMSGNFDIFIAHDGIEGIEKALEIRPDCMIIDVVMPGLDGYQLVRAIRGDPDTEAITMIILSAMSQQRDQYFGMVAGADQYLTKPVSRQVLLDAIAHAVKLSQKDRYDRLERISEEDPPELSKS